jgi:alanine dehydrogenase
VEKEYSYLRPDLLLFAYLHLAANPGLVKALLQNRVSGLAYETIQRADGSLPLLAPMSEIAGKVGAQEAAALLAKHRGGKGVLIGGAAGVPPATVVILGGGISGQAAAGIALGMGARVLVLDVCPNRLRFLSTLFGNQCSTAHSNQTNIRNAITDADIVIGCILVPGAAATHLVTRQMLSLMEPGGVLVDIAIDQGGCFETSRPTTHEVPTFVRDGIVHYCVANIPGAVPRSSTIALSNATLPYIQKLAGGNLDALIRSDREFNTCLNTYKGRLTHHAVGKTLDIKVHPVSLNG